MSISLRSHLDAVALVNLESSRAADELSQVLARFGPPRSSALEGWPAVRAYLSPLRSLPTRYVVIPLEGWSLLLVNMRFESAHVDALAISRRSRCLAVSATVMPQSRHFHLIRDGEEVRDLACYKDGGKWFFVERGEPQPWEATRFYHVPRKSDRLTPEMVALYVEEATGVRLPLAWNDVVRAAIGIERGVAEVRVPIASFEVEPDV